MSTDIHRSRNYGKDHNLWKLYCIQPHQAGCILGVVVQEVVNMVSLSKCVCVCGCGGGVTVSSDQFAFLGMFSAEWEISTTLGNVSIPI